MNWQSFKEKHTLPTEVEEAHKFIIQLIQYRKMHNVSQQALAKTIGMTQSQLSKIETFEVTPKLDIILRIMDGLGLTLTFELKNRIK